MIAVTVRKDSPIALYKQVKKYVEDGIREGKYKPDEPVPSELELAEMFGVSRVTTRKALEELCQEGLVYRIQGKGTYVSGASSSLRTPEKHFGIILPLNEDYYSWQVLAAAEHVIVRSGNEFILRNSNYDPDTEKDIVKDMVNNGVDGLLVFTCLDKYDFKETYQELLACGYPIVFVDRYVPEVDSDSVVADNFGGAYEATQYLLKNGHQRIAVVASAPREMRLTSMIDRVAGYKSAHRDWGVPVDDGLFFSGVNRGDSDMVKEFLLQTDATAVFALNDFLAIEVFVACKKAGLRVPDDMSIVGFDDMESVRYLEVPITTVRQPMYDIGKTACELLMEKVKYQNHNTRRITLPTELIIRKSVANISVDAQASGK